MRFPVVLTSVLSLLVGLVYAPFFHIHSDEGVLHVHFLEIDTDHFDANPNVDSIPEVEAEHGHPRGSEVPMIAGRTHKVHAFFADLQSAGIPVNPPQLCGVVIEQSVHGPGPPAFRDSNPRSPPA